MSYAEDWQRAIEGQGETAELVAASVAERVPKEDLLAIIAAYKEVMGLQAELERERAEHAALVAQVAAAGDPAPAPSSDALARRAQQLRDLLAGLVAVGACDFSTEPGLREMMQE